MEIFRRRGGGGRVRPVRKSDAAVEPQSEPAEVQEDIEEGAEKDSQGGKVVLKNPRWESEKVGFNEEAKVSVDAELPTGLGHRTRVEFELFAKTPSGHERISKGEGFIKDGKASGIVPVYIPEYRDEDGKYLAQVDYFFTAKHSQSNLLDGAAVVKSVDRMAEKLIASHILEDKVFAVGKSLPTPDHSQALKALVSSIRVWKANNPDGKIIVIGHMDAVGEEKPNKTLSERRAKAVHAFLTKDASVWETLSKEESKGQAASWDIRAFMEENNDLALSSKDFDSIDGLPHAGCSEFNLVKDMQGECRANRRVSVLYVKSSKHFAIQYPCKAGDISACKRQIGRKGTRRTKGFGCLFYDQLVTESAAGSTGSTAIRRLKILDLDGKPISGSFLQSEDGLRIDPDGEGWFIVGEDVMSGEGMTLEVGILAMNWNAEKNKDTGVA